MIDWLIGWSATLVYFALCFVLGLLVERLLRWHHPAPPAAQPKPKLCQLSYDHMLPGYEWCHCTTCGQCVQCPEEDRP